MVHFAVGGITKHCISCHCTHAWQEVQCFKWDINFFWSQWHHFWAAPNPLLKTEQGAALSQTQGQVHSSAVPVLVHDQGQSGPGPTISWLLAQHQDSSAAHLAFKTPGLASFGSKNHQIQLGFSQSRHAGAAGLGRKRLLCSGTARFSVAGVLWLYHLGNLATSSPGIQFLASGLGLS